MIDHCEIDEKYSTVLVNHAGLTAFWEGIKLRQAFGGFHVLDALPHDPSGPSLRHSGTPHARRRRRYPHPRRCALDLDRLTLSPAKLDP
jgi:hypothetical protein